MIKEIIIRDMERLTLLEARMDEVIEFLNDIETQALGGMEIKTNNLGYNVGRAISSLKEVLRIIKYEKKKG